jgi:hypothetical protein
MLERKPRAEMRNAKPIGPPGINYFTQATALRRITFKHITIPSEDASAGILQLFSEGSTKEVMLFYEIFSDGTLTRTNETTETNQHIIIL